MGDFSCGCKLTQAQNLMSSNKSPSKSPVKLTSHIRSLSRSFSTSTSNVSRRMSVAVNKVSRLPTTPNWLSNVLLTKGAALLLEVVEARDLSLSNWTSTPQTEETLGVTLYLKTNSSNWKFNTKSVKIETCMNIGQVFETKISEDTLGAISLVIEAWISHSSSPKAVANQGSSEGTVHGIQSIFVGSRDCDIHQSVTDQWIVLALGPADRGHLQQRTIALRFSSRIRLSGEDTSVTGREWLQERQPTQDVFDGYGYLIDALYQRTFLTCQPLHSLVESLQCQRFAAVNVLFGLNLPPTAPPHSTNDDDSDIHHITNTNTPHHQQQNHHQHHHQRQISIAASPQLHFNTTNNNLWVHISQQPQLQHQSADDSLTFWDTDTEDGPSTHTHSNTLTTLTHSNTARASTSSTMATMSGSGPSTNGVVHSGSGIVGTGFANDLQAMVWFGIPAHMRRAWYMHFISKMHHITIEETLFDSLVKESQALSSAATDQIMLDLARTVSPKHRTFINYSSGQAALRRVLCAYALRNPKIGYCQAMNFITAQLLLGVDDHCAFWMLSCFCESLFPAYYVVSLQGLIIDMHVIEQLLRRELPQLMEFMDQRDCPVPMFLSQVRHVIHFISLKSLNFVSFSRVDFRLLLRTHNHDSLLLLFMIKIFLS
eukprot:c9758_g1_i1.p1 GENE.c9758_g1_i1~~c9758_g1_i1.p1  ORF type:complete len:655 (+),score=128.86 c9758_g1_i1:3-1967(+)